MSKVPKILIVEDQEEIHRLLSRVFGDAEVRNAFNGFDALALAREWKPDLVISDHCMPGMTGVELLTTLREDLPECMRVLITACEDRTVIVEAVNDAGIHQFIEKPFQIQKLRLIVNGLLREQWLRSEKEMMSQALRQANRALKDQQALLEYLVDQRTRDLAQAKEDLERTNSQLSQSNSSLENSNVELERANRRLQESLMRDSLTSLYTRQYVIEQLHLEIARAQRYERPLALLFVDIDHFKLINDNYGHPIGDEVLIQFGKFFHGPECQARATDIAGRYGGEEFLILLPETAQRGAVQKGERLRRQIRNFDWTQIHPKLAKVTASFGASFYPEDGASFAELLATADQRLYLAKRCGRDLLVTGGNGGSGNGRLPRGSNTPEEVLEEGSGPVVIAG